MPLERRRILFLYSEFWPYCLFYKNAFGEMLDDMEDYFPLDACHTSLLNTLLRDRRERFAGISVPSGIQSGLIVLCQKKEVSAKSELVSVTLPDDALCKLFISLSVEMGIALPKHSVKRVVSEDLCAGIEVVQSNTEFLTVS